MLTLDQMTDAFTQLEHNTLLTALGAAVLGFLYLYLRIRRHDQINAADREAKLLAGEDAPFTTMQQLPCPPSTLPILGNTLDMGVWQRERLYDWFLEQCELHKGPWRLKVIGRQPAIVIASPKLFEDVLKTNFEVFQRGASEVEILRDFFGDGIFTANGDAWHRQRTATAHIFGLPAMKTVMYDVLCEKVRILCDVVGEYAFRGEEFSLKSVMTHFAADVFTKMALGVERNNLENGLKGYSDDFIESSRTISYAMQMRYHLPMWLWKLLRHYDIGLEKKFKESIKYTDFLIYPIINESLARKSRATAEARQKASLEPSTSASFYSDTSSSTLSSTTSCSEPEAEAESSERPKQKDLISIFLENNLLTKSVEIDAQVIRDTVINFISPGTDTTSHCMSFFLVMMNRYPKVLKKIREELQTKLPKLFEPSNGTINRNGSAPKLTVEDLSKLTYLEAAIHESLRLNPQYPVTTREAIDDTVLSDGTFVRKGTRVIMVFYAAMRRRSVWGDDAMRFKPERWLDPVTGGLITVSPYKFSAFFAGPRKCLGVKFALMEVKMTMAVLLSRFQIKTSENPWFLTYQVGLALSVKGPVMVHATPFQASTFGRATA